jgi:hypothetical protein
LLTSLLESLNLRHSQNYEKEIPNLLWVLRDLEMWMLLLECVCRAAFSSRFPSESNLSVPRLAFTDLGEKIESALQIVWFSLKHSPKFHMYDFTALREDDFGLVS